MATPDQHNACPACPQPVRILYYEAQTYLELVVEKDPRRAAAALERLRRAVAAMQPFVSGHFENQNHAVSRELEAAREPACP